MSKIQDSAVCSFRGQVYNSDLREFRLETYWILLNPPPNEWPLKAVGVRAILVNGNLWMLSKDSEMTHGEIFDNLVAKKYLKRDDKYKSCWFFRPNRLEIDGTREGIDHSNLGEFSISYL